jgi:sugar lactone lactonase YvrE
MQNKTDVLVDGFGFLEGPRWHDNALWASDIGAGVVVRVSMSGMHEIVADVPGKPSGLGFLPDGTPIVVSMENRIVYQIDGGRVSVYCDLSSFSRHMLNDMVVDPHGRAFVDNSGYNPFEGGKWNGENCGSIILVKPDKQAREVATDLAFPNGLAITSNNRLIVAESRIRRISSFKIDPDGGLSDRRVVADLDGDPDGICLDKNGGIWIGLGKTERFVRIESGVISDVISTPGRKAVACQLGGADMKTLFCLTHTGDIKEIARSRASRVERFAAPFVGTGSP